MEHKTDSQRRHTLRRLKNSVTMFLGSPVGGKSKLLLAALLVLMLCINGMNVVNSFVGRYFMSAIEKRDMDGFITFAWMYVAVFAGSTVVAVLYRFAEERLGLLWREWLTTRIVGLYVDQRIYLHFESTASLSNPDQRMTEDVKQLTVSTLSFLLLFLNGTMTVISFSGVLWSISPTLFVVAVLYAAVGSAATILLGRPLMHLNYRQADYEADFRSELIRVRENAAGIAVTGSQNTIRDRIMVRIDQLVANFRRIIAVNRNLSFFTTGYNYMIQLIPALFVAPLFIQGKVEFGVIGQSAMAFATLLAAFSLIITQFQAISAYASVVTRLSEFVEASEKAAKRDQASCIGCFTGTDRFVFSNLTLRTNGNGSTVLINQLNATFVPGKRVLILSEAPAASFALFRASAGLWDAGEGRIERPSAEKLAFLPERPYLPPGSARELLIPAGQEQSISNDQITRLFEEISLVSSNFRESGDLEIPRHWPDVLSLSKQQLLSVARAILARPDFVFLDHMESALNAHSLRRVLEVFANHGITCISFAEAPLDPDLYDATLMIRADGSWTWKEASAS